MLTSASPFASTRQKASEVTVGGDWIPQGLGTGGKLARDEQGVWALTVGPLPPDFYSYSLVVDGVRTLDPKNAMIKQGVTSVDNMFFVPGSEAAYQDNGAVPHGEVRKVWYQSSTLGTQRRLHVYTPPGYDSSKAKYPVFYLLHGGGDEDSGWSTIGRAGFILDNLIAAKKGQADACRHAQRQFAASTDCAGRAAESGSQCRVSGAICQRTAQRCSPLCRKEFPRHDRQRKSRSGGTFDGRRANDAHRRTAPDQFGYVGVWSAGVAVATTADFEQRSEAFLKNADQVNKNIKLFEISCGDKDTLAIAGSKNLDEVLKKHNIKHETHISGGGHTWINWRQYLNAYAQKLFR